MADDIPAEAVEAAIEALDHWHPELTFRRDTAIEILAAALPHIRARVLAEVDAALRDEHLAAKWREREREQAKDGWVELHIADYVRFALGRGGEREEGTTNG